MDLYGPSIPALSIVIESRRRGDGLLAAVPNPVAREQRVVGTGVVRTADVPAIELDAQEKDVSI